MILRKLTSFSISNLLKHNKQIPTYFTPIQPLQPNYINKSNCIKNNFTSIRFSSYNVNTNVTKDVILFKYENPKLYKMLNIFAFCQFGFWAYLSHFAFTTLRDAPVEKNDKNEAWWRRINLGDNKYRYTLTFISFLMGYGILAGAWMFSLKSVRFLVLRKGGQSITFVTYSPFGKNRMMTVELKNICCMEMRETAKTYIPVKVRNHYLHYLLDMKGEFKNKQLFDNTAGLKRVWK